MQKHRLNATVHGHVQGVGFRYFVQQKAEQYRLSGWVKNTADGTVQLAAEGQLADLNELLQSLRRGPSNAFVTDVTYTWAAATDEFDTFTIRA